MKKPLKFKELSMDDVQDLVNLLKEYKKFLAFVGKHIQSYIIVHKTIVSLLELPAQYLGKVFRTGSITN